MHNVHEVAYSFYCRLYMGGGKKQNKPVIIIS